MSLVDVTARIGQIQSQLAMLSPQTAAVVRSSSSTGTPGAAGASSASAATFAATLDSAQAATFGGGSASGASEQAVVSEARKYLGIPYVWGGTDPAKGLDCSGLVQRVYKNLGYDLPRVSYQQATAGRAVNGLANAKPGDILAFNHPVSHVAIYIGDNKMIEAPRPGTTVRVSEVYATPTAIRRILPEANAVSPASFTGTTVNATSFTGSTAVPAGTPYASLFSAAAQKYGVDASLLAAVAKQESGYNPKAVSHAGAQGLMQLMPGTAKGLGVTNSFDPAQAVDGAARMLKGLMGQFGRTDLALAAYNAGPGAVTRYNGMPPYPETMDYVRSVLLIQKNLRSA